jgi:hypothetical protein
VQNQVYENHGPKGSGGTALAKIFFLVYILEKSSQEPMLQKSANLLKSFLS